MDRVSGRIICLQEFKYVRSIPVESDIFQFAFNRVGSLVGYRANGFRYGALPNFGYNTIYLNSQGQSLMESIFWIPQSFRDQAILSGDYFFPQESGAVLAVDNMNDTIFTLSEIPAPRYILSFSNRSYHRNWFTRLDGILEERGIQASGLYLAEMLSEREIILKPEYFLERKEKIIFGFKYAKSQYVFSYDASKDESILYELQGVDFLWYCRTFMSSPNNATFVLHHPRRFADQILNSFSEISEISAMRSAFVDSNSELNPIIFILNLDELLLLLIGK